MSEKSMQQLQEEFEKCEQARSRGARQANKKGQQARIRNTKLKKAFDKLDNRS